MTIERERMAIEGAGREGMAEHSHHLYRALLLLAYHHTCLPYNPPMLVV